LLHYAYGLTGNPTEAQDLVQEAYARAWQRWRRLVGYDDQEAWLRLVVTRLATDRWRRLGVRRAAAAASRPPAPVDPPSENTVKSWLARGRAGLAAVLGETLQTETTSGGNDVR
jgi:RNA polymerase sigma-70 factor (ECF subfamily)